MTDQQQKEVGCVAGQEVKIAIFSYNVLFIQLCSITSPLLTQPQHPMTARYQGSPQEYE